MGPRGGCVRAWVLEGGACMGPRGLVVRAWVLEGGGGACMGPRGVVVRAWVLEGGGGGCVHGSYSTCMCPTGVVVPHHPPPPPTTPSSTISLCTTSLRHPQLDSVWVSVLYRSVG